MMDLPPFEHIKTQSAWDTCAHRLRQETHLAIDMEANSMFAYREQVCLIQISIPTQDFIVDPLGVSSLAALGEIFADTSIQKIFHAAEYDLMLVKREYGWEINNLFDTMWAARILGYPRIGLASMLEELFDLELNKRYQRSNWCKRPLSDGQLTYAQHDTHHLFRLRERLLRELGEQGRLREAEEIFAEQSRVKLPDLDFDPEGFWSINGIQHLNPRQRGILKELNIYRDRIARRRDQPPFKIFNDRTLLELARAAPHTRNQLNQVYGMTKGQIRRYGDDLLRVIRAAREAPPPRRPRRGKRPDEDVLSRYDRLHQWRKERAQERGVESDVILSRDALWEIARENPEDRAALDALSNIGDWRCATYGDEILQVLHEQNQP